MPRQPLFLAATAALAVLLAASGGPAPAQAAFPGENGRIVFHQGGTASMWAMNPDGGNIHSLEQDGVDPALSPDGTRIAFQLSLDIWVADADGTDAVELTTDGGLVFDEYPSWSPDGRQIVFSRADDIAVIDATGGTPAFLTSGDENDADPDWSPDGQQIAFVRDQDIWLMDADGGNQAPLTDTAGAERDPDWSPTGQQLVYSTSRLWIIDVEGGGEPVDPMPDVPLSVSSAFPRWSPDGTKILFSTALFGLPDYELGLLDLASGEVEQLTDDDESSTWADWAPAPPDQDLFEGWNAVPNWPGQTAASADAVVELLDATISGGWQSVAWFDGENWLQDFQTAPLPSFNTLPDLAIGETYWLFVPSESTIVYFPSGD
jgi:Tol biopolymer transport system component